MGSPMTFWLVYRLFTPGASAGGIFYCGDCYYFLWCTCRGAGAANTGGWCTAGLRISWGYPWGWRSHGASVVQKHLWRGEGYHDNNDPVLSWVGETRAPLY